MSSFTQTLFQDGCSYIMQTMSSFHDHLTMVLVLIMSFITYISVSLVISKAFNNKFFENHSVETIWTILPSIVLIVLALPSMKILYAMEESKPHISLKVVGHQWYWSYEYPDFNVDLDSYMKLQLNSNYRLLDVDNRVILPMMNKIRAVIGSEDVIHSWAVPSLALKMDAVPGRLNQVNTLIKRPGLFFGQCSEICGANHSFMPISLEVVSLKKFLKSMN